LRRRLLRLFLARRLGRLSRPTFEHHRDGWWRQRFGRQFAVRRDDHQQRQQRQMQRQRDGERNPQDAVSALAAQPAGGRVGDGSAQGRGRAGGHWGVLCRVPESGSRAGLWRWLSCRDGGRAYSVRIILDR
jgi:hypothetical protein